MRDPWGFIPGFVPNSVVLFVYGLISRHGRVEKILGDRPVSFDSTGDIKRTEFRYIEDQKRRTEEPFGRSTMARAGCEVIAMYNALGFLYGKEAVSLKELKTAIGKNGIALSGYFGTNPGALYRWLTVNGVHAQASTDKLKFNKIARESSCAILSFYNDVSDIRKGVHTICLTRERSGFIAHNLTEDGRTTGPFASIDEFFEFTKRTGGLYIIGITDRLLP